MITTCTYCHSLYEAGSEEQANEPDRLCALCRDADRALRAAGRPPLTPADGAEVLRLLGEDGR
jgi:hypothetical protein